MFGTWIYHFNISVYLLFMAVVITYLYLRFECKLLSHAYDSQVCCILPFILAFSSYLHMYKMYPSQLGCRTSYFPKEEGRVEGSQGSAEQGTSKISQKPSFTVL